MKTNKRLYQREGEIFTSKALEYAPTLKVKISEFPAKIRTKKTKLARS